MKAMILLLLLLGLTILSCMVLPVKTEQVSIKAVILDSWGADYPEFTIYPLLNSEWSNYGSIPITIDYTSLNKENITYADILSTEADVLIISHAYPKTEHIFTDTEISAIKQYAEEGHGLIGTYGTIVPENNRKLSQLFGMNQSTNYIFYPQNEVSTGKFKILDITHPLFASLANPFCVPMADETIYVPSHNWTIEGVTDGAIVALTTDSEAAIIVYTENYKSVYFTNQMEEYNGPYINQSKIFYNAIVWTAKPPLKVSISPIYSSILLGDSVTFSSNVSGGYAPYNYQWFLNGVLVPEATSQKWVFTPTSSGTFTIYLRVIDSQGITIKSKTSRIKVYIVSKPKGLYRIYPL